MQMISYIFIILNIIQVSSVSKVIDAESPIIIFFFLGGDNLYVNERQCFVTAVVVVVVVVHLYFTLRYTSQNAKKCIILCYTKVRI